MNIKAGVKELYATVQSSGYTQEGLKAMGQLEALRKLSQYGGAIAPVQGIGQDAIDPLRVIEIITKVRGLRPNIYTVEQGFTPYNVDKLDARTPEQDTRKGQAQMRPFEKLDFDKLAYAEGRFSLKPNAFATLIASESMKRSDFSLQQLNSTDAMIGHARMRNGQALFTLSTSNGAVGATPTFQINDPEATGSGVIPNAQFNVKKETQDILQTFLETTEAIIDRIFINPVDYTRWDSNYFVGGKGGNDNVPVSGVMPFKGIEGVTAYLDRAVPRGLMYAVDSQSAMKGIGPFETEFWREYSRNSHAFVSRDYVQFILPNPGRFSMKIQIDGTGSDAFVPGSEIDSQAKFEAYVNSPDNLLNLPVIS